MSMIATAIASPGITRIFFDLRVAAPDRSDERRIAAVIERASVPIAASHAMAQEPHAA